eukprot:gnl/TRDRNA2_/TRDRNA2_170187_c0_seq1.p1 gnl/TRDRNA2_/TRDRNA2_170187_c0~~gnl/TRDRNA2_/TRDRNA2_170187_c0_seq1.p1  ORF type:complete len:275 (+),score=44.93 gnl/TRDRNA2_/TRDRNA2_170187_c0_seq1:126-950(+)
MGAGASASVVAAVDATSEKELKVALEGIDPSLTPRLLRAIAPAAPVVVGYWKIRGLAAPIRMLCEYAGANYEVKLYDVTAKDGGGWDVSAWFDAKPELKAKNSLMNLPYVTDGDMTISQTVACFKYLGQKYGLAGSNPKEEIKVDQVLCEVQDLRNAAVARFYAKTSDEEYVAHLTGTVKTSYGKFENWLAQEGTLYTAGATPTAGDFHLWEMLDQHEMLAKDKNADSPLKDCPKLKALYEAMKSDAKLANYFGSDLYRLPVNNKMASWGSTAV